MLHDLQQEEAAAKVLLPIVTAIRKDATVATRVNSWFYYRKTKGFISRYHYFLAQQHAAKGDDKQQRASLEAAVKADETDADVLIAMYRLKDQTPEWKAAVKTRIEKATVLFRGHIKQRRDDVERFRSNPQFRSTSESRLATANNQFAWLVSNTFGDFDEALRCSHRSLELKPDAAGYLDTLGRCYFAKRNLDNAIKYQSRAVELEPHSGAIRRQLELFKRRQQETGKTAAVTASSEQENEAATEKKP